MSASEYGSPLSQNWAVRFTPRAIVSTWPSFADTITDGSPGPATGRASGLIARWKKSLYDFQPQCASDLSVTNSYSFMSWYANGDSQPCGLWLSVCRLSGEFK